MNPMSNSSFERSESPESFAPEKKEGRTDWRTITDNVLFSEASGGERCSEYSPGLESLTDYLDCETYSTKKERIDRTPREDTDRGEWTGERGESTFIPSDEKISEILEKYGLEGIDYKDGIPDFSECSEGTVEIDNMTDKRYGPDGNFAQADEKCAEQWNAEKRDGRDDWTARDVKNWREENGYSWHERNDMKTCDLVPTAINDYFGHLGGVSEYKKLNEKNSGGGFDE